MSSDHSTPTMVSRPARAAALLAAIAWLASSTSAFRPPRADRGRGQSRRETPGLCHRRRPEHWGDDAPTARAESAGAERAAVQEESRRSFVKHVTTAAAVLLTPPFSCAKEEEEGPAPPLVRVATLLQDESDLDAEVARGEAEEKRSIEGERQLIKELKRDIALEKRGSSTPEQIERAKGIVRGETESLIREEERLQSDTATMLRTLEALESEVAGLEGGGDDSDFGLERMARERDAATERTLRAFKEKLKARAAQQEDLIARLRVLSEKDVDPRTGKYHVMTHQEYVDRVEATDVDFVRFLKDTVASEKEWQRDLAAFEGFLDKVFGPAVRELSRGLEPAAASRNQHYARRSRMRFEAYCRESAGRTDSLIQKLSSLF